MQVTIRSPDQGFTLTLADEAATRRLAAEIADIVEPGDLVALSGDSSAAKQDDAARPRRDRASCAAMRQLEVPGPTFHAGSALCPPRLHAGPCRPIPVEGSQRTCRARARRCAGRGGADGMAGPGRRCPSPHDRFEVALSLNACGRRNQIGASPALTGHGAAASTHPPARRVSGSLP